MIIVVKVNFSNHNHLKHFMSRTVSMIMIIGEAYLLWGDLIGGSPHVNLLVHIDTWDDEEDTFG